MKIFKQAVKKIESMVRSFLLLSMMFLAVGIAYGDYSASVGNWGTFEAAYDNQGQSGDFVLNLTNNIVFESWLYPYKGASYSITYPAWTTLTIIGNSKVLNDNSRRGFYVSGAGKQITLENVIYKDGSRGGWYTNDNGINAYGGAVEVLNRARLILKGDIIFDHNEIVKRQNSNDPEDPGGTYHKVYGGAIGLNDRALLLVDDATVTFTRNRARQGGIGGAIVAHNRSAISFINSSITFIGNRASEGNGAIGIVNSSMTVINSKVDFIGNSSLAEDGSGGGALVLDHSTMTITNSVLNFENNDAGAGILGTAAGALAIDTYKIEIRNSKVNFSNNRANLGGAIYYEGAAMTTIEDANFTGNTADLHGGAIVTLGFNSAITIKAVARDVIFSNNKAAGLANDIFVTGNTQITFDAAEDKKIDLQGGIVANSFSVPQFEVLLGNVNITKQGAGELILSGRNQLRGTLDIQAGTINIAKGEFFDVDLTNLTVAANAVYSTVDDDPSQETKVTAATITGTVELDVDFDSARSDKLSATGITFNTDTGKLAIKASGEKYDSTATVVIANTITNISDAITHSSFLNDTLWSLKYAFDSRDRNGKKEIIVYSKKPIKPATLAEIADDGFYDISELADTTVGASPIAIANGKKIIINGGGKTIKSDGQDDRVGLLVNGSGIGQINDLSFSDFKGDDGKAIVVANTANLTIAANKSDVIFKNNTTDLDLADDAVVTIKGNKNVIFNDKVAGIAGTTINKEDKGAVEFKGELAFAGTLNIYQGAVKVSTKSDTAIAAVNINGGALEFGSIGYITATTLNVDDNLDSWLSLTEDVAVGKNKGIIKIDVGNSNIVSGSTVTTRSSDGRYETTMWVYKGPNLPDGTLFSGGNAGNVPFTGPGIWAEVVSRKYFGGDLSIGGISLSDTFIANALRENAMANTGAIYSNFDKTAWASFNFDGASVSDDENFGASGFGGQAGYKFYDSADVKAGVFAGFGSKNFKQGSDEGSMSGFGFGIYGGYFTSTFGLKGFVGLGIQSNELKNGGTKAEFDSTAIRFGAEAEFGAGLIKPFAGFEAGLVSNPDIDVEVDGNTAATIDANTFTRFALLGGVKLANKQDKLSYFGKGYLGFLLAGAKPEYNSSVKISETKSLSSTVEGSEQQAVYLGLGAGIDYAISNAVSLFANIDTKVNADIFDYQGNVGASFRF